MPKYTRFYDIPQLTKDGVYQVNVDWPYLEQHLQHYAESYGLVLNPDYQRGHVWTQDKQIAYVEFVLRGGKSSRTLYLNCPDWMGKNPGKIELVDGLQRLTAVRAFLNNEIPAFDSFYQEYTDRLPFLVGPDFVFNVNNLPTRADVLRWYIDLNSGGVVHTQAEIEKVKRLLEAENKK